MKTSLKYFFSYVLCAVILVISFSKGFLEIDYAWMGGTILESVIVALLPIILYLTAIKAKVWVPVTLFIIFSAAIFYFYIQTQENKFSTWFKEEQIRQLVVLAMMIVTTMVLGLYKKTHLRHMLSGNSDQ